MKKSMGIKAFLKKIPGVELFLHRVRELNPFSRKYKELAALSSTLPPVKVIASPSYMALIERSEKSESDSNFFYSDFETVFRGSNETIRKRQEIYLEYVVESCHRSRSGNYFLDVGCGRGEFLEILQEKGIQVKGLEVDKFEYKNLQKKGFDVELAEANDFLENAAGEKIIGISAFQVVEHFDAAYLKNFIALSFMRIINNGVIILETVNPKCAIALSNFYLDVTHVRPYPPELLKFLLEWHGFKDVNLVYSSPCDENLRIKNVPEHNYMDYAVVGWKR